MRTTCTSLPFTYTLPRESTSCHGRSYQDTVDVLATLKQQLRDSAVRDDATCLLEAAMAVALCGQVWQGRLRALGDDVLPVNCS